MATEREKQAARDPLTGTLHVPEVPNYSARYGPAGALKLGQWRPEEVMPLTQAEESLAQIIALRAGPLVPAETQWLQWIEARKEHAKRATR